LNTFLKRFLWFGSLVNLAHERRGVCNAASVHDQTGFILSVSDVVKQRFAKRMFFKKVTKVP
jgi:hypothetical protein